MSAQVVSYCVALLGASFSACAALILIRTLNHLDDPHG
jgi:hypothetical protein